MDKLQFLVLIYNTRSRKFQSVECGGNASAGPTVVRQVPARGEFPQGTDLPEEVPAAADWRVS